MVDRGEEIVEESSQQQVETDITPNGDHHHSPQDRGDYEDGEDEEDEEDAPVQLGFAEPIETPRSLLLFRRADWHKWDGGKIGGKPVSGTGYSP